MEVARMFATPNDILQVSKIVDGIQAGFWELLLYLYVYGATSECTLSAVSITTSR